MNAQIIAIVNQKGGVGKTTTCVNLNVPLSKQIRNVLLLDTDTQGSLTIIWDIPDRTSCLLLYSPL